jgi:phage baseplate assembly protein W
MLRQDYAFPFAIDRASRKAALAKRYDAHVEQMIEQVLLTSPGERIDLPDFGCGIRRLLFAPNSAPLVTTVQLMVQQSLVRWLSQHINIVRVTASSPEPDGSQIAVRIDYVLRETLAQRTLEVIVR